MKPIAIVQHDPHDGPAYFATWLSAHGLDYRLLAMHQGDPLPHDIRTVAGLAVLGGPMSANDALPYYPALLALLQQAFAARVPVIGHCLGGQLMGRALGGHVQASEQVEIGWSQLEPVHALAADWFGTAPLQLFQWHAESFSVPDGATQLLRGRHCANQAFVLDGLHLAMQFHCEVDVPKLRTWLELGADEVRLCTSPGAQTGAQILHSLDADVARSQQIASRIYQRWAEGLR